MGGQRGAGAKYCAPTFNSLSDSGVQWDGYTFHTMLYYLGWAGFCSFHATCVPAWGFTPRPTLRGSISRPSAAPSCASGFASLAWSCPRYAISDGGFAASLARRVAARRGWQRGGMGGVGFGLFGEEVVGEGGDVGYIDGAVGVDVGDCFAVGF